MCGGLRTKKAGWPARHHEPLPHQANLTVSTTLYRDVLDTDTSGRHGVYVSLLFYFIALEAQCHFRSVPSLYLDPQIRDWVLFPITLVMVCFFFRHHARTYTLGDPKILVGVLRHYVVVLLQSSPTKLPRAAIREQ